MLNYLKKLLKSLINFISNMKLGTKIILIILLLVGGGMTVKHIEQKEEMIKIAKEHKQEMDKEVRYGDKDHHIKSITYEWNSVEHNPMGGFELQGYVNGDKDLGFGISFDSDDGGKNIYCYEYRESESLGKFIGDYYD